MKLLLYCTKAKPYLYFAQESRTLIEIDNSFDGYKTTHKNVDDYLNGKIVAECDFEVEEICSEKLDTGVGYEPLFYTESIDDISKQSCLRQFEIENYLGCKANGEVVGYAIHIKNLHIFNEFKELSDYIHPFISCSNYEENNFKKSFCRNVCTHNKDGERLNVWCDRNENWLQPIKKAPQNMMRVELDDIKYILISIKPEWLVKILNGEKTIEVRKKVLKEMMKNV